MIAPKRRGSQVADEFVRRVRAALGSELRAVYWFGSRVQGTSNRDSDFDLLVETEKPLSPEERDRVLDVTIDIISEHDCLLDVHYYTTHELHAAPYAHTPFVQRVLEEACVL